MAPLTRTLGVGLKGLPEEPEAEGKGEELTPTHGFLASEWRVCFYLDGEGLVGGDVWI